MSDLSTVASQLQYCTSRIEVQLRDGATGVGTGFFFNFNCPDNRHIPVLVTNKHVVHGAISGEFVVHLADETGAAPSGETQVIKLSEFESRWIPHPSAEVDICILILQPIFSEIKKPIFRIAIDENICLDDIKLSELSAIEDVVMIGYPRGLWDHNNYLPIIRRGITATNPASNFQGKSEGAVDIAAFHGSSGSPIFIYNHGAYPTKDGIVVGSRIIFLGTLYAGPIITKAGATIVRHIPMTDAEASQVVQTVHLGYYVKAKELLHIKHILETLLKLNGRV